MSQQFQPQIYPYNNVPVHPDSTIPSQSSSSSSSSSSHSNGSFGTVFLVLAVILVVSVLACIANRLCRRRSSDHTPKNTMKIHDHGHSHGPHGGDGKLPREWEGKLQSHEGGRGDLELGNIIIGSAKVAAAGGDEPSTSSFMAHNNGGGKGPAAARFAVHHMQFKPAIRSSSSARII